MGSGRVAAYPVAARRLVDYGEASANVHGVNYGKGDVARCYHRPCGLTFGGVTAFDRHIRLLKETPWVECLPPASVGLIQRGSVWGVAGPTRVGATSLNGDPLK